MQFEFGRHETFAPRYGWLAKGLARASGAQGFVPTLATADALGLGSRMAKSLGWWLEATGLGGWIPDPEGATAKSRKLVPTPLGSVILARDPFMEYPATWWMAHLALCARPGAWEWFFSTWRTREFERAAAGSDFLAEASALAKRAPTEAVARRDVNCLLQCYSTDDGASADPEDATSSPLAELGLVRRSPDTGRFRKTGPSDVIPVEMFMACASGAADGSGSISLDGLAASRRGPASLMGMNGTLMSKMADASAGSLAAHDVTVSRLGGVLHLSVPDINPAAWLSIHFDRIGI